MVLYKLLKISAVSYTHLINYSSAYKLKISVCIKYLYLNQLYLIMVSYTFDSTLPHVCSILALSELCFHPCIHGEFRITYMQAENLVDINLNHKSEAFAVFVRHCQHRRSHSKDCLLYTSRCV